MSTVQFTINGKPGQAAAGSTILQAAEQNGVFIPTLCHDERLKPFGSCMICRVEVEGARGTMLACGATVTEGIVIRTESPEIARSRRVCLELLLSEHHGDCVAPCSRACPAHIDIKHYIEHIQNGDYEKALRLIKEKNPLPLVCGRICTRPCEDECRRNLVDERVGIDHLKRFAADYDLEHGPWLPEKKAPSGKKIAVIGAGPAGLSCAWYSALNGHEVTVFERHPKAGGMLRYGIPSYRLPRDMLDAEVALIAKLGVRFEYGVDFGRDFTAEDLKKRGYDAIFLGVGSQKGWNLGCDGEESCQNIDSGVEFLGRVEEKGNIDLTGRRVMVVGGGNTAIDAARTSLRLGAKSVEIVYRRGKAEMPAHDEEIAEAELEGVQLRVLTNPKAVRMNGDAIDVTLARMALGEPDASGRRRPVEVEGSEFVVQVDRVISAIGQTQDLSFATEAFPVEIVRSRLVVDAATGATALPGVYAGGDAVTGAATAIEAIAAGGRAAAAIDDYLQGRGAAPDRTYYHVKGKTLRDVDGAEYADREKLSKTRPAMLSKEERVHNFREVEKTFTEQEARAEAARCLACGCKDQNDCKLREFSGKYGASQFAFPGEKKIVELDERHPVFERDPNKCILCGRCVRICTEVQGAGIFGFRYRGYAAVAEPYLPGLLEGDKACGRCRLCVETCPTGALVLR